MIFGVADEDFSFTGVSEEVYETADQSSVVESCMTTVLRIVLLWPHVAENRLKDLFAVKDA